MRTRSSDLRGLRCLAPAVGAVLLGCALDPRNVGDQHGSSSTGEPGTTGDTGSGATSSGGEPGTSSGGEPGTSSGGEPSTSSGGEPGDGGEATTGVEQTHVVISDCGLPLACEPFTMPDDFASSPGLDCAQAVLDSGASGFVDVFFACDGDVDGPHEEQAIVLLPGQTALRQRRSAATPMNACASETWGAWGPHESCQIDATFAPDSNFDCEEVADWTCEEIVAATMAPQ